MIWTIIFGVVLVFLIVELLRPDSQDHFKPGRFYYTKKWLFQILLFFNSRKKPERDWRNKESFSRKDRGFGRSIQSPSLLEGCQPLEDDPFAIDTVYFNGFDRDGTSLALRIARKHNREGELWLWLDIPGIGFFQHPILPDTAVYNMEDSGYRALGARLQVIEPMRSWRVSYNGILRKGLCNDTNKKPDQYVNVKMTFKWECFNDPFNFDVDLDKNLLADAIAREKWTRNFWEKLKEKHQTHYEQCGELTGQIEIEGHDARRVYLKSFRDHTFGVRNWEMFYRYAIHFIWIEEVGIMAMVAVVWMPDYITLLKSGYLTFANGETYPVTAVDLDLRSITKDTTPPDKYSFTFNAADELYKVDLVTTVTPEVYHYRGRTSRVLERFCTYTVNGRKARGLTEYHYRNPDGRPITEDLPEIVTLLREPEITEEHKGRLTLTFQEKECQSSLLTGGKGSQLAMLTSIQEGIHTHVPKGFCLTLAAFEQQIQENSELGKCLEQIVASIRNEQLQNLQGLCMDAVELLAGCRVIQPIESQLTTQLQAVFGKAYNKIPLAVRSSAAGEDGGEASSAGQMETYLGVRGLDGLLEAVRKCWASAYSYQAVEYRRQQGQPVRTSVAVVIQEMVSSDVSGVLFTADPVTGSPNRMVMDASYGLGEENSELGKCLEQIVASIRNEQLQNLQGLCMDAVELLAGCRVIQPIESQLTTQLQAVFGKAYNKIPLAVRSSAAGEDGGEASSAGQMETYLGVRGLDGLLEAVRKCWASAYSYQAVEYRRQQGQPVRTSVAVVIQEMVSSDVSGVLFTADPVTGSPNRMVMDASYGLGEAVVSGKANPDTIIIQRLFDNTLKIISKKLGDKDVEIRMTESGGVQEIETKMGSTSLCCLDDDHILQLCQLAIKVEEHFGSPRDIEWAIHRDQIYLLQARPITTMDQETDDDIIHEFDTPMPTGQERLTLGNIGEMMPGVVTPLTGSVFGRAVDRATSDVTVNFGCSTLTKSALKAVASNCGRLFINLTWIAQVDTNSILFNKKALEMNILGQTLEDHTVSMIKTYGRENKSLLSRLYCVYHFHRVSTRKLKIADGWYEKLKSYSIGAGCPTAAELYQAIDRQLPDYYEVWATTIYKSAKSGTYGGIVMGIVSGGKDEWTTANYSDVALLLSQCNNVYSAEVPMAMRKIAKAIVEAGEDETFVEKSDTESVQYLTSEGCPVDVRLKYEDFMKRHGHRCIREAEFIEKSWRAEPEKLIRVLKTILKSKAYEETKATILPLDEAVAQLKSPISAFGKFLLRKWILNKARDAVGQRELGKSVAVDLSDRFKQAYWTLADLLFKEGRLPERELMFYLTHHEIGQLINTRSAKLVTKAMRRRKLLPVQDGLEFPRISVGRPQPIVKKQVEEKRKATFTMTGMPVSVGKVKGTARVVRSLDDADNIQRGDILVVCYTDVGWSPYFPLISGLVTEMGGLISHGAVVAREYGLPCVVNVPDATRHFRSGDFVELDGASGCIHRLEEIKQS